MAALLLLANDRADAAELAAALTDYGHSVLVERSARAGLVALEEEPVDVIIADEVLPGMTAVDVVAAARSSLGRAHLPAIIFSRLPRAVLHELPPLEHVLVLPASAKASDVAHAIARLTDGRGRHRGSGSGDVHAK